MGWGLRGWRVRVEVGTVTDVGHASGGDPGGEEGE